MAVGDPACWSYFWASWKPRGTQGAPASCDPAATFDLPEVYQIVDFIVLPAVDLCQLGFLELLDVHARVAVASFLPLLWVGLRGAPTFRAFPAIFITPLKFQA